MVHVDPDSAAQRRTSPTASVLPRGGGVGIRILLSTLAVVGGWLAFQRDGGVDGYFVPLKAWALVLLCLAPGYRYAGRLQRAQEVEPVPFVPMLGVIYSIFYAWPVLLRDQIEFMRLTPAYDTVAAAVDLALVGWCALLVAFYGVAPRLALGKRLATRWEPERARRAAGPLIVAGIAADLSRELVTIPQSLNQIVFLLELLFPIGLGMLLILSMRGALGLVARWVVWGALVPLFIGRSLGDGVIGELVYAIVFLFFLVWTVRRRIPWLAVVPLVVAMLLLKASLVEFRQIVWRTNAGADMTEVERAELALDLIRDNVDQRGIGETLFDVSDQLASRTAAVATLAHVIERTPRFVPYSRGETYETLPATLIPRVLWPGKPTKRLGQWFGHRYGLLDPWDKTTSVNLPQLVELYLNFGALGIVAGMFVFGLVYRWLYRLVNYAAADDGTILASCLVFSRLINIESDWSLVFGTVLQMGVVLWLVMRYVGGPRVERRARAATAVEA